MSLTLRSFKIFFSLHALLPFAGFFVTLYAFYPGFMDFDPSDQYAQVVAWEFTDWHPLFMALLWKALSFLHEGPLPMLVLELALYWGAVFCFLDTLPQGTRPWKTIALFALFCAPNILNLLGCVLKDTLVMGLWVFPLAYAFRIRSKGRRDLSQLEMSLLIALVICGALMRFNAMLIAGPIVMYLESGRPFVNHFWKNLLVYALIVIGTLGINSGIQTIMQPKKAENERLFYLFDIVGVEKDLPYEEFLLDVSPAEFRSIRFDCWDNSRVNPLSPWGHCPWVWEKSFKTWPTSKEVFKDWLQLILNHPGEYLKARVRYFKTFLFSRYMYWMPWILSEPHGITFQPSDLFYALEKYILFFESSFIILPITYVGLAFLLLFASLYFPLVSSLRNFIQVCSFSSLLYVLSYFPLGVASDMRYTYFSTVVVIFALGALLSGGKLFLSQRKSMDLI